MEVCRKLGNIKLENRPYTEVSQLLNFYFKYKSGPGSGPSDVWLGDRFTHQFQAKPCRCSRCVTSIIERIDLGLASNPIHVLINLKTLISGMECH